MRDMVLIRPIRPIRPIIPTLCATVAKGYGQVSACGLSQLSIFNTKLQTLSNQAGTYAPKYK